MSDVISELDDRRIIARAPDRPIDFGSDHDYIVACLRAVERSFALTAFPGLSPEWIPARALIRRFITWWRTLEPINEAQRDARARLPGAIRLIDTYSAWLEERRRPRE
jgi:hypothetical protein